MIGARRISVEVALQTLTIFHDNILNISLDKWEVLAIIFIYVIANSMHIFAF